MSLKTSSLDAYDFIERVYRRIVHGNFQKVANLTKKHRSQHSREWNPEEPLNPPVVETCEELIAWKEVQPEVFEMQADLLTDVIVRLRAGDFLGVQNAGRVEMQGALNKLTTAWLREDEEAERSAMVTLRAMLDSRLRQLERPTVYSTSFDMRNVG